MLKEVNTGIVIATLLMLCSPECANFVWLRNPKSEAETTEYMTEFDKINGEDSHERQWRELSDNKPPQQDQRGYGDGQYKHRNSNDSRYNYNSGNSVWTSTCFSCGSRGHKANECPKRKPYKGKKPSERKGQVKRVVEADNKWKKELVVTGEFTVSRRRVLRGDVNRNECELLLDTGANLSAIVPRLVQKEHYTGSYVVLEDFRGESMMAPLAKVTV